MNSFPRLLLEDLRRLRWFAPVWLVLQLGTVLLALNSTCVGSEVRTTLKVLGYLSWGWTYMLVFEIWAGGLSSNEKQEDSNGTPNAWLVLCSHWLCLALHLLVLQVGCSVIFWLWLSLGQEEMRAACLNLCLFNAPALAAGILACLLQTTVSAQLVGRVKEALSMLPLLIPLIWGLQSWPDHYGSHGLVNYADRNRVVCLCLLLTLGLVYSLLHVVRRRLWLWTGLGFVVFSLGLGLFFWPSDPFPGDSRTTAHGQLADLACRYTPGRFENLDLRFSRPADLVDRATGELRAVWIQGERIVPMRGVVAYHLSHYVHLSQGFMSTLSTWLRPLRRHAWNSAPALQDVINAQEPAHLRGQVLFSLMKCQELRLAKLVFPEPNSCFKPWKGLEIRHRSQNAIYNPSVQLRNGTPSSTDGILLVRQFWHPVVSSGQSLEVFNANGSRGVSYSKERILCVLGVEGLGCDETLPVTESSVAAGEYQVVEYAWRPDGFQAYDFDCQFTPRLDGPAVSFTRGPDAR